MKNRGFLDRLPAGEARNITPNGTVRDSGAQSPWSNGFLSHGSLGTVPTSPRRQPAPTGNRTGESQ